MSVSVLIGYLAKKVVKRPDWIRSRNVSEICSVSGCISPAPEHGIERWTHNGFGLYNTERLAWDTVPIGEADQYTLFAYRMLPLRFDKDGMHEFDPQAELGLMGSKAEPGTLLDEAQIAAYTSLGYDVVSRSCGTWFECSPLSCNGLEAERKVNAYCLLDSVDEAIDLAKECGLTEPEPGPYHVLEVLRKRG